MGLSITGYVLEPPRVGQANSSYTSTPNVYISDQAAFDLAYPTDESEPRTDYHVFVLTDGDFPDATFCWTKNEVIDRFDYDGKQQRFKTSPGAELTVVGTLTATPPDSNTERLSVTPPTSSDFVSFPIRLSVGSGVGTAFTVALVANDGAFGTPAPGTVELSIDTGNLNWAAADLVTYDGLEVHFQQQQFFDLMSYNGRIGLIEDTLLLNPLPATGQYPLIRISTGEYLTPVEVASLGTPTAGTVQWDRFTGELRFNATDITANAGKPIYYDGVAFAFGISVFTQTLGTVNSPGNVSPVPPEESDLFFRVPSVPVQFAETVFVDSFSPYGKRNQVEVDRVTGAVQFSLADQAAYGSLTSQAVVADLDIERGMTLRMFRSPADPTAADDTVNDVSAFYVSDGATLADPTIGFPFVTLPALPVETEPLMVYVRRGLSDIELPRLDVPSPPVGIGFILDIDQSQIQYARRKVDEVVTTTIPYGAVQLPDPVVFESNLDLWLEDSPMSGTYVPLTVGDDVLFDYTAGLATMVETDGALITQGSGASFNGTNFTDLATDFVAANVQSNDLLLVLSGTPAGVYTIDTVSNTVLSTDLSGGVEGNLSYEIRRGSEIVADRFFKEVPNVDPNTRLERLQLLGATTNAPRLTIDTAYISATRFRFGLGTLIPDAAVSTVPTAGSFTAPASMTQGYVEIAEDSGELNFSQDDVNAGEAVFWARTMTLGADYQLQPANGFIQLTERMLELEQIVVTYTVLDENDEKVVIEERGSFIVRKELTEDHPNPTDTLYFNPLAREVAENPPPQAFRGGRPQVTGEKVVFDTPAGAVSSVRFLPYDQVTDALPSGATVNPNERVYIDYFVHEAVGGEKTLSILQPPMVGALINIEAEQDTFILAGDRTGTFLTNYLLRIDREEVYLIGSSVYDSGTDLTTITLASPQVFRSDFLNPGLAITSGATRTSPQLFFPSYFVIETDPWETPSRGASKIRISGLGDLSRTYKSGTVLMFTDGGTFVDFNLVTGSVYNEDTGKTEVSMTSNSPRQYNPSTHTLKRSVRPVLEGPLANTTTSQSPILTQSYGAYRRVEGEVGQILTQPDEYNIDDAGNVTFSDPLQDNEELGVFYTGTVIIEGNRRFKASYTHGLVPTDQNNLLGLPLKANYTTYVPDSFYWRVETFTDFRGELVEQYEGEAEAAVPTGGPILENAGGQALYEKGRESVFYQEGRLYNEDEVARATLVYFNDAINLLEDALQSMDGRVVGDHDGRFLFDGLIDNPTRDTWSQVTNQIDDLLWIRDTATVTFPPFAVVFSGIYQEAYKPANSSRFYPQQHWLYSVTADPTGLATGDTILDLGKTGLSSITTVSRRLPWAVVTKAALAIENSINVDNTDGDENLFRPPFEGAFPNMLVVIQDRDGTFLVPESAPLTVLSKTSTKLTFTAPIGVAVPVGATIRHISYYDVLAGVVPPATPYLKSYRLNFDVGADLENGLLTHIQPFPPFDGSFPVVPPELYIQNPAAGEILDILAYATSATTEPFRPPALDGGTTDDDGNRSFPILNPSLEAEGAVGVGYLDQETSAIVSIQLATDAPFVGTGDLDAARVLITNQGGNWPAPIPKVYDLVTINDGLNGPSTFRQITAVGVDNITVGVPFGVQDFGFNFTVTTCNSLLTRPVTGIVNPFTRLTDAGTDFNVAQVKPGHTVVFTSGAIIGERRQVTAVVSSTELDIEATNAIGTFSYRIDNSVPTFGGTNSLLDDNLEPTLDGELAALSTNAPPTEVWNERDALEMFLDLVFTDIVTSTQGETSSGSPTLNDSTVDFEGPDPFNPLVTPQDFVYIRSSTSAGIYQVLQLNSPTSLNIDGVFPDTGTGISYRVVSSLGATITSLESIYAALARIDQAILDVTAFKSLVTTPVTVVGDTAFARRTTNTDLNNRLAAVAARLLQLNDPATGDAVEVSEVMVSKDKLYDRRWVWIDARINQEKGILPKKDRAVTEREKALVETKKQLTKLLTMRL